MKTSPSFPGFFIVQSCLLAGLVLFAAGCAKKDSTDAEDKAASPPESRRAGEANGEAVVKLPEDEIKRVGLEMVVLPAATGRARQHALGVVVDLQSLFDGAAALADVQAQVTKTTAAFSASAGEYDRAKKLHDEVQSVSTKDLEAAAAVREADDAASRSAQAAWQARRAALEHQWGPTVVAWLVQNAPEYQSLAKGETLLVRVAQPGREHLATPPTGAALLRPDKQWTEARFVSPSPQATPEFQTEGFFFVVGAGGGLLPGMNVEALLSAETGPEQNGVMVPDAAIVWWQGRAWIFVQTDKGVFTRREIATDQPEPDGGYFAAGFPAGQTVVVRGAQILLSEETKPAAGGD